MSVETVTAAQEPIAWLRSLVQPLTVEYGGKTGYCLERTSGYAANNNLELLVEEPVTLKHVTGAVAERCLVPSGAQVVIFRAPHHWHSMQEKVAACVWFGGSYQLNIRCNGAARLIDTDFYVGSMSRRRLPALNTS